MALSLHNRYDMDNGAPTRIPYPYPIMNTLSFPRGCTSIGIDVSSAHLTLALRGAQASVVTTEIDNTAATLKVLVASLKREAFTGRIVMEATGRYHLLCALMLSEAGHRVYVVNPMKAKKYSNGNLRRSKTDKVDAGQLAEMAEKEEHLGTLFTLNRREVALRLRVGLLHTLEEQLQRLRASLSQYRATCAKIGQQDDGAHLSSLEEAIRRLEDAREEVEAEIKRETVREDTQAILSIKGISPMMVALLTMYCSLDVGSAKQWVAYLGLDVGQRQSGTWRGRGRLTKRGNGYLRKRLFSAAWGMKMHDTQCKAYYDHLRSEGRSYKESMIIIARKLVRVIFAMLKSQSSFDASRAFSF
jgi:transposase